MKLIFFSRERERVWVCYHNINQLKWLIFCQFCRFQVKFAHFFECATHSNCRAASHVDCRQNYALQEFSHEITHKFLDVPFTGNLTSNRAICWLPLGVFKKKSQQNFFFVFSFPSHFVVSSRAKQQFDFSKPAASSQQRIKEEIPKFVVNYFPLPFRLSEETPSLCRLDTLSHRRYGKLKLFDSH